MTNDEIRDQVLRVLGDIAPEVDLSLIRPDRNLRDQLDIDSMDWLSFMIALDQELHVAIPESDYRKLATLDGCVAYLGARLQTSVPHA